MAKHFFIILAYFFIFINTQDIPFPQDNKCEQLGSLLLNHLLFDSKENISIPTEMQKIIRCSGSSFNDLGDYYGCKNLNNSAYYLLIINLGQFSGNIGLCYFKECTIDYYMNAINHIITILENLGVDLQGVTIIITEPEKNLKNYRKNYKIGLIIILTFFFFITLLNLYVTYKGIKTNILGAFNLNANAMKIFSRRDDNNTLTHLRVFDGLRFISCWFVVYGHCCYFPMISGPRNSLEMLYIAKKFSFNIITSAIYAVDVFFYMAGFLLYFSVQKFFNKEISKTKTIINGLFNRYLRLFPFILIAAFLISFLLPFLSNSSNYSAMSYYTENCRKLDIMIYNLLYLQNYYDYIKSGNGMCIPVSWYLACDMQFFIYSIFIIVIFNKNRFMRFFIFISTFIICNIYQFYLVIKNNYNFNDYINEGYDSLKQFYEFYIRPYVRISPYLLGIFFCELLLNTRMYRNDYLKDKKKEKKNDSFKSNNAINQINNTSEVDSSKEISLIDNEYKEIIDNEDEKKEIDNNWLFRLNIMLEENRYYSVQIVFIVSLILFNLTFWTSSISNVHQLSKFWSAMNNCFGKIIHVFSIGCIMHLTFLDKLKFIQKIFSFKIQTYIGRNTYGIYLIHAYLIIFLLFEYQTYYYLKITDLFILSFGIFAIAWLLSFVLGLLIESPVIYLSKILNSPDKKKKKKSPLEEKIIDDDEENKLK